MKKTWLDKGTLVEIHAQGLKIKGSVITADYWSDREGWYIELTDSYGTYRYWKQRYDGGRLVSIDGEPHTDNFSK